MLLVVLEVAIVLPAVGPEQGSYAFLLVLAKGPYVLGPVGLGEHSLSMHLVVFPGPLVATSIRPLVQALSIDVVVPEGPTVGTPVGPGEHPLPLLLAMHIVPLIGRTIWPLLSACAVLPVLFPKAGIDSPVFVPVYSHSVAFMVDPVALIDISVDVDESAVAVGLAVAPEPKVDTAVLPDLDALALFVVRRGTGDLPDVDTAVVLEGGIPVGPAPVGHVVVRVLSPDKTLGLEGGEVGLDELVQLPLHLLLVLFLVLVMPPQDVLHASPDQEAPYMGLDLDYLEHQHVL